MSTFVFLFFLAFISVSEFGAVSDWNGKTGADATGTDNATAFAVAIREAESKGQSLYIPSGRYLTTEPIRATKIPLIYGDGNATQIYNGRSRIVDLTDATVDCEIRDLALIGGGQDDFGIRWARGDFKKSVRNVSVRGLGQRKKYGVTAIQANSFTGFSTVENCVVTDCRYAIDAYISISGSRFIVCGNYCKDGTNVSSHGIDASAGTRTTECFGVVANNICEGFRRHGIQLSYGDKPIRIVCEGNAVRDCLWSGIYSASELSHKQPQRLLIQGNTVENCGGDSTGIEGGICVTFATGQASIANNLIFGSGYAPDGEKRTTKAPGIFLNNCERVLVSGNAVERIYDHGIKVLNSRSVDITGNAVRDVESGFGCVYLNGNTAAAPLQNVTVQSNTLYSNGSHGVVFASHNNGFLDAVNVVDNVMIDVSDQTTFAVYGDNWPPRSGVMSDNVIRGFAYGVWNDPNYALPDMAYGDGFLINGNTLDSIRSECFRLFAYRSQSYGQNNYRNCEVISAEKKAVSRGRQFHFDFDWKFELKGNAQ